MMHGPIHIKIRRSLSHFNLICTWPKAYWNLSHKFHSELHRSIGIAGKPITDIASDFLHSQTVSLSLSLTSVAIATPLIHPQPAVMLNVAQSAGMRIQKIGNVSDETRCLYPLCLTRTAGPSQTLVHSASQKTNILGHHRGKVAFRAAVMLQSYTSLGKG